MKTKYWAIVLCAVVLVLGIVACSQQATQELQEPVQTAQQTEPVTTTEPMSQAMEVKQEVTPTAAPTAPAESEPGTENEVAPVVPDGEPEPAVELFTEVNETVYATGAVNLRASWSAESEKLGSLSTGDAVTRTGVAIEGTEAEGWSRIQLSDGSTVYVSNRFLSTTKPVVQNTNNGGGGTTQTTQPSSQGDDTTQTQPSSGTSDEEKAARRQQMVQESGGIGIDPSKRVDMNNPDEYDAFLESIVNQLNP